MLENSPSISIRTWTVLSSQHQVQARQKGARKTDRSDGKAAREKGKKVSRPASLEFPISSHEGALLFSNKYVVFQYVKCIHIGSACYGNSMLKKHHSMMMMMISVTSSICDIDNGKTTSMCQSSLKHEIRLITILGLSAWL